jgi:hypothetical protein
VRVPAVPPRRSSGATHHTPERQAVDLRPVVERARCLIAAGGGGCSASPGLPVPASPPWRSGWSTPSARTPSSSRWTASTSPTRARPARAARPQGRAGHLRRRRLRALLRRLREAGPDTVYAPTFDRGLEAAVAGSIAVRSTRRWSSPRATTCCWTTSRGGRSGRCCTRRGSWPSTPRSGRAADRPARGARPVARRRDGVGAALGRGQRRARRADPPAGGPRRRLRLTRSLARRP